MKKFLKVLFVIALMICYWDFCKFCLLVDAKGGDAYYHYIYRKQHEPFTFSRKTNTDSILQEDVYEYNEKYIDADESVLDEVKITLFAFLVKSTRTLTDKSGK